MFVVKKNTIVRGLAMAAMLMGASSTASAADRKDGATSIPLVLTLTDVEPNSAPLHISV